MPGLEIIARMRSEFPEKFGIPRQSGLASALRGTIVFEPAYRNAEALRGLEGFSHIWLLWGFSANRPGDGRWSPTVRPPRLGGNRRMGVFATRSPYRPNPIGLSCVRLLGIEVELQLGMVIRVAGGDLMDGTPIYDIKPYLPYADSHPEALRGFASEPAGAVLTVEASTEQLAVLPEGRREALVEVLALDPRPSYQDDPEREYGMTFAGYEVRFRVTDRVLHVLRIDAAPSG